MQNHNEIGITKDAGEELPASFLLHKEYRKEREHKLMEKNYQVEGTRLIYQMPQEVDHHIAKELCKELDRLIESQGIGELVLDFSRTEFMDSSGIGVVIGRSKTMGFRNGSVKAMGIGKRVDRILRSAGLYRILKIAES